MGLCLPCLGGGAEDETPDPDVMRRQLAEAAEKRQMESANRGIKNPMSVEQKKKKKEEVEKMTTITEPAGGGGGLRVGETMAA
ncbi:small VCP/p97-interacting protein, partial [Mantella aurantiaca]